VDVRSVLNGHAVPGWHLQLSATTKADAGDGNLVFCPCKDCKNERKWGRIESVRMHLITKGFMPNYTMWSRHGEVGENVPQENNDDVAMPDVAVHESVTNKETGVNTQPVATVNDVFRNILADHTEHDDGISQLLCNVESGFLSDR